ncbi:hypothetical protein L3Q82_009624, partial [Scortum barcoo]
EPLSLRVTSWERTEQEARGPGAVSLHCFHVILGQAFKNLQTNCDDDFVFQPVVCADSVGTEPPWQREICDNQGRPCDLLISPVFKTQIPCEKTYIHR